jgi:hypothetical protein
MSAILHVVCRAAFAAISCAFDAARSDSEVAIRVNGARRPSE